MKIRIEEDRCEGHGRCWETVPDLIEDDDRGRGVVSDPTSEIPTKLEEQARAAARVCPERAVILSD
jgi:ferredoxin